MANHVGLCVRDLARARRFYEGALGFERWRDLAPPDAMTARLTALEPPLGVRVAYLRRSDFVLELLHYTEAGERAPARPRVMNEIGLTHVAVVVDDLAAACARVGEHGGTVLEATRVPGSVTVRDPDGQVLVLREAGGG